MSNRFFSRNSWCLRTPTFAAVASLAGVIGAVPSVQAQNASPYLAQPILNAVPQNTQPQVMYRPRQVVNYATQVVNIPQWQYEQKQATAPYTYYVTEYKDVTQRRYRPRVVYDPIDVTVKVPQLAPRQAQATYQYTVPRLGFVQQQRVIPQTRTVYDAMAQYGYSWTMDPGASVLGNQGAIIPGYGTSGYGASGYSVGGYGYGAAAPTTTGYGTGYTGIPMPGMMQTLPGTM